MKRILANKEYCIGCRLCEIHCVTAHSVSKDIVKAFKIEGMSLPRIRVEESGPLSFAVQCRHCEEPLCVYSCITGAMTIGEDGSVVNDSQKCVGCWTCILVCPYGAISRDEVEGKVVSKCDMCAGSNVPACVENCPNEALTYVDHLGESDSDGGGDSDD